MHAYWLTFNGRGPGCIEADDEAKAQAIAKEVTGFESTSCKRLPYPANPRINQHDDPKHGVMPAFCYAPTQCCGRTACPQKYSCTE